MVLLRAHAGGDEDGGTAEAIPRSKSLFLPGKGWPEAFRVHSVGHGAYPFNPVHLLKPPGCPAGDGEDRFGPP